MPGGSLALLGAPMRPLLAYPRTRSRVLIVSDDDALANAAVASWAPEGGAIAVARDRGSAVRLTRDWTPDVVILGLGLGRDGAGFVRAVCDEGTALLDLAGTHGECPLQALRFGTVEIQTDTRTVRRAGRPVAFRPKEYDLLLTLARHRGRILSRETLLSEVWGYQPDVVSRTVDTHVAMLRGKLEDDPLRPQHIKTARTAGYYLAVDERRDARRVPAVPERIVVVGPTARNAANIRAQLEAEGRAADLRIVARASLRRIREMEPTLVVVDLDGADRHGPELLNTLRGDGVRAPILVWTTLDGFASPAHAGTLVSQVMALLRWMAEDVTERGWVTVGHIAIHPPTRSVRRDGKLVELKPKEYDVLLALLRRRGSVVSRAELLREVWRRREDNGMRSVDNQVLGLRRKLEPDPSCPTLIVTAHTRGYMLRR